MVSITLKGIMMSNVRQLSKTKILAIIKEELNNHLAHVREVDDPRKTTPEGVPPIPRGRAQTQKQSGIERGTAAMLNDLLSRVEELERAEENTRKLLHQILKSIGAME